MSPVSSHKSGFQFFKGRSAIRITFADMYGLAGGLQSNTVPDPPAARNCEQPQPPVAGLTAKVLQHLTQVLASQPFCFGHGSLPSEQQIKTPTPSHMGTAATEVVEDVG